MPGQGAERPCKAKRMGSPTVGGIIQAAEHGVNYHDT